MYLGRLIVVLTLAVATETFAQSDQTNRSCGDADLKPFAIEGATHGYGKLQPDGIYLEQVRQSDPAAVQCYFAGWELGFKERFQLELSNSSTRGYISGNEWASERFGDIINGE